MFLQSVKMAWEAITSNKARSFLTMLGIIIGVAALVVMVSLVNGATGTITDQVEALGSDLLAVNIVDSKGETFRLNDLAALADLPEVEQVSPATSMQSTAKHLTEDLTVTVHGITPAYYDIQDLTLGSGRFLKSADVDNRSYVAVLAHNTAEELFGDTDIIGREIAIDGRSFEVVGVLAEGESMMASMINGYAIYVPFTVESRMAGQPTIDSFCVSAADDINRAETAVKDELMRRFKQDKDAFFILNMSSISGAMESINSTLSLLLGSIAAISLLVGGIGIMNIMLVSVTERTREIGIRKAIGAGHRSIMAQFLIEALVISLMGCGFGLILSQIILIIATAVSKSIVFTMSGSVVALAVLFSSGVGLLFGIYPANKAAKKQPIEALRYAG